MAVKIRKSYRMSITAVGENEEDTLRQVREVIPTHGKTVSLLEVVKAFKMLIENNNNPSLMEIRNSIFHLWK